MFILKNFIIASAKILGMIIDLGVLVIILDVVFSWVNASPYNRIVHTVGVISDSIMNPIRKRINLVIGVLDLTPVLVLMFLYFVKNFLIVSLIDIAVRM